MATLSSEWVEDDASLLVLPLWWLKDPLDPSRNTAIDAVEWNPTRKVSAGVFYPRGRDTAVVVSGDVYKHEGTLKLRTLSQEAFDAVGLLVYSSETLLLQSVLAQQWYVRVVSDVNNELIKAGPQPEEVTSIRHAYMWTVPLVEVDAP